MALVKLEIDGKRIIADGAQTILEVARQNGIRNIPTLCHDEQLEPFASCFLCVVKVKGARTLLPACSTKVTNGMVVETETAEVRRSRKAALELLLSDHYADCLGPCQLACPASVDIQGYIALAALGKYEDAIRLVKERNPLPAICGRVCTRPCEVNGCRRNLLDEPVGIDYIKRYLADLDLGKALTWRPPVAPASGKNVAVVGAGPAGLACAYYLALRGHAVHLFEAQPEAGGMLRYGIPEYRLPKDVLDLEINQILDLGVKISTNVALGRDFTVTSLKAQGFHSVFLGLGAWESTKMRVQDEGAQGVLPGIEFLHELGLRKKPAIHGKVLVVGGGNTAIDCARTALRLGATEVHIVYRRTRKEMPANELEIVEAEHEGIAMDFLVAPTKVVQRDGRVAGLECIRMELGEPDASGRRSPKPLRGSEFTMECDYVLAAIGQGTQVTHLVEGKVPGFLPPGEVLNLTRWQTIQVDEKTGETSVEGVFSGGDVVTGAATAVEAIAAGRKAACAIDHYVRTGKARPEPKEFVSKKDTFAKVQLQDLRSLVKSERRKMPGLPADERKRTFAEVEVGYTADDLRSEASRCLECGCTELFTCDLRRYATEYGVDVQTFLGEARQHQADRSHPLIELDPNKCILCSRCVRMCSEVVGVAAYGLVSRGFITTVQPALGGKLLETDCVSCGACIETCPTGAIIERSPLAKPGPWQTTAVESVCDYCGSGCRLDYEVYGTSLIKVSRAAGTPVHASNHCRKGRFGYSYVQASERLLVPRIRPGRELQETTMDDAVQYTAMRLKELSRRYAGREMAVFLSPRLTNEEVYLAQKLARVALGTHNVASFANLLNPDQLCPEVQSTASYRDVIDAQTIVVLDSELDEEHFAVDVQVKRAIRKGSKLIYIGTQPNRTAAFAEVFLQCQPGTQAQVLAELVRATGADLSEQPGLQAMLERLPADTLAARTGVAPDDLAEAARILKKSVVRLLVFNQDYRGARAPHAPRLLAGLGGILGCQVLALREKANMQGLLDMGGHPGWLPGYTPVGEGAALEGLEKEWCVVLRDLEVGADVATLLREKKIKVAVVLGEDPLGCENIPADLRNGLLAADFLVVGDLFMTTTAWAAHVVLPLSSTAETSGTVTNHERRIQRVNQAIPPRTGMENWQVLCKIASLMGFRFRMKYSALAEVTEEIGRVVPAYRKTPVNGPEVESIWDRGDMTVPAAVTPDWSQLATVVQPLRTLHLDCLEGRFDRWFRQIMADARKSLAAGTEAAAPAAE